MLKYIDRAECWSYPNNPKGFQDVKYCCVIVKPAFLLFSVEFVRMRIPKGGQPMKLYEKIYQLRKQSGMSQEETAEKLNVSRQALSRWENGTAQPAANNIVEISKLFEVATDFLLNDSYQSDDDIPAVAEAKKVNHILRTNLTMIAIVAQMSALNIAIQPVADGINPTVMLWIKAGLLLATSIWMASNHRYETDLKQRAKNTKLELVYCCIQASIALIAYNTQLYFLGAVMLIAVGLLYLLKINPKYMNRKFTK